MAEVAVCRQMFAEILSLISSLFRCECRKKQKNHYNRPETRQISAASTPPIERMARMGVSSTVGGQGTHSRFTATREATFDEWALIGVLAVWAVMVGTMLSWVALYGYDDPWREDWVMVPALVGTATPAPVAVGTNHGAPHPASKGSLFGSLESQ